MKLPTTPQKLIILGLTLLAFWLRAYRLDFQSYWIDEAWTVYYAQFSLDEMWQLLRTAEAHPPFYHPSTIYWLRWVGESEYAMRFYALVFGVLAIPLTYRLGKDLGDDRLGLVVALLMTVAPYQIWHSQEARMYSLLTAASTLSMWGFVNLWRRGGWGWWLVYVVGTEWAITSHYHGLALIGIQGLFLLLTWRRHWRRYPAWGGTLVIIFLLYLPWLVFSWDLLRNRTNWVEQTTLWDTYVRSAIAYSTNELVPRAQAIPLVLIFVAVYGLGLVYATRRRWGAWSGREMLALLLAYTIAPNFATWLYGELQATAYFERYLILVQVGYLLTVAMGILAVADGLPTVIAWVKSRVRTAKQPNKKESQRKLSLPNFGARGAAYLVATCLLLLLIGINGWVLNHHYFDPVYAKPDWRAVVKTIENFSLPGDAIVLTGDGGEKVFDLYYRGNLPVYSSFNTPVPPPDEARQIIADIAATYERVWFTPYGADIDTILESWLAHNAYPAWHSWLGRKRLALYGSSMVTTDRLETLNITFSDSQGQALTLVRVAIMPDETIAAGDLLPLQLTWQTDTQLAHEYQLSLRLSNGRGDIFAQSDWPPLAAAGSTSTWSPHQPITDRRSLWLPPDIPPGHYVLQFVVYDPSTGQMLGRPALITNIPVGPAKTVVPPEALAIPNRTQQSLGDLTVVGYALPEKIQPGQEMWLWLYWQVQPAAASKLAGGSLRLSLSSQGETVTTDFRLVDPVGPLASWQPGQVRRAVYHLPTSPRLSGETGQVKLALISADGQVEAETSLAQIALASRSRQFELPPIAYTTEITLGQPTVIKLIGYDLPATPVKPGQALPVTLYWQAEAEMGVNYTVFVQLLNSTGQVVAQVDLPPQGGAAPTTTWLPGEILTDPYSLALPNLPPGGYRLITGLYHAATGERLPATSGGDFVELGQVTVE